MLLIKAEKCFHQEAEGHFISISIEQILLFPFQLKLSVCGCKFILYNDRISLRKLLYFLLSVHEPFSFHSLSPFHSFLLNFLLF